MKTLISLLLLLTCNIGHARPGDVVKGKICRPRLFIIVDRDAHEPLHRLTKVAVDLWNDALKKDLLIVDTLPVEPKSKTWGIVKYGSVDELKDWPRRKRAVAILHLFNNCIRGGKIIIDHNGLISFNGLDEEKLLLVLVHEIGHLLGLNHSEDVHSVMYHNLDKVRQNRLGRDTQRELNKLYGERK